MVVFFVEISQGIFGLLLVVYVEDRVFLCKNDWPIVLRPEQVFLPYRAIRVTMLILQLVHDTALCGLLFFIAFCLVIIVVFLL